MFSDEIEEQAGKSKSKAASTASLLEGLVTTFMLALLLITFVVQTFIIPTGSMADTLKGAHYRIGCDQCGWRYDYGFIPELFGFKTATIPKSIKGMVQTKCPNCGHFQHVGGDMHISKGDKILVTKCIYPWSEPKRWDVIVFKNPTDPTINYIKRLIGLPGEKVEIIDGDIYINDKIARKSQQVQSELWMPIYNHNFQPVRPQEPLFTGGRWETPLNPFKDSQWKVDPQDKASFVLDGRPGQIDEIAYGSRSASGFVASYAYNDIRIINHMPVVTDIKVTLDVNPLEGALVGVSATKYGTRYAGWVDIVNHKMVLAKVSGGSFEELVSMEISETGEIVGLAFMNVDHMLVLQYGDERIEYDLGDSPDALGERLLSQPDVRILGSGKLKISHIQLFRDQHYTTQKFVNDDGDGTAVEGNPLLLNEDEFFVLGDNSPSSEDGRWWSKKGIGNAGKTYTQGTVPREYLMGKALVVFWPSGYKPTKKFPISIVPNKGRMKFIYGGGESFAETLISE